MITLEVVGERMSSAIKRGPSLAGGDVVHVALAGEETGMRVGEMSLLPLLVGEEKIIHSQIVTAGAGRLKAILHLLVINSTMNEAWKEGLVVFIYDGVHSQADVRIFLIALTQFLQYLNGPSGGAGLQFQYQGWPR